MSSLKELCNELDKIEPGQLVNLEGEVKPHDNIAGIASVEIKRICTLRANTADAGIKLSRRIMLANNPDEVAKLEEEITRTDKKCDLLDSLLWFALRDEFKLWGKHSVGIKKGFVVVWADETSKENEEKSKLLEDKEPGSCDK
ncbi:hypothetical protein HYT92_03590, partial [Candidatus Pacearchaeota archaeon]|nr:hypothetical protein [Candidatus Pacearchaeota archaeon]